jgi:putative flippase GtrA
VLSSIFSAMFSIEWWKSFILPKLRFAASSSVATLADYLLYLLLVTTLSPVVSNLISASTGMVINFILQKRYIFQLKRRLYVAFGISLFSSVVGIGIGTLLIWLLNQFSFFAAHQYVTKALVTGLVFFYNFYMKRFAFERKWRSKN